MQGVLVIVLHTLHSQPHVSTSCELIRMGEEMGAGISHKGLRKQARVPMRLKGHPSPRTAQPCVLETRQSTHYLVASDAILVHQSQLYAHILGGDLKVRLSSRLPDLVTWRLFSSDVPSRAEDSLGLLQA